MTVHEPRESLYRRLHNCRLVRPYRGPEIGVSQKGSFLVGVSDLALGLTVQVESGRPTASDRLPFERNNIYVIVPPTEQA